MVLRFSISAMIYIFYHPSPSHQFPQSQIAGSRTYVGHCAVGWPNATFASGIYQRLKYLAKAFGQTQIVFIFGVDSNIQKKVSITKKYFFLLPKLSKVILNGYWLIFNQNSTQATCQVFYILTFALDWISKMGVQWIPDLLVLNITFHTCSSCSENNS